MSLSALSSRLDYCNTMLYGINDGLLTKLQTVQNVAARVVTGTRKFDHITSVLRQLHWLPVRQRITFKLAMITFKGLRQDLAPSSLADVSNPVSSVVCRWQRGRQTAGHSSDTISLFANVSADRDAVRSSTGRLFHVIAPARLNNWSDDME